MFAAACASVPTLRFNADDDAGTSEGDAAADSTVTPDAGDAIDAGDTGAGDDASGMSDSAFDLDAGDAAVVRYKCGNKMVLTCANCAGNPMLCLDNGRNECLSDCQVCNTALAPCVRCLANGDVVGQCVTPGPTGAIACGHAAERCLCGGDAAACPFFPGSNQTCIDDGTGTLGCETCGELGTTMAACVGAAGAIRKCQKTGTKVAECK